jgi:hypothetical protein
MKNWCNICINENTQRGTLLENLLHAHPESGQITFLMSGKAEPKWSKIIITSR